MAGIDPTQARRTNQILWLVLLASQVVYVALILTGAARAEEPVALPAFPIALAFVAVATGIGAHLLWRRAAGTGRPLHAGPPEPAASFRYYLLAWVFDESIAIYGLLLGMLAFPLGVWAPFSLAAFVLMLAHRPS